MANRVLMPEQQVRLVEIIIDETDRQLITFEDFQIRVGILVEDIAGFEFISDEQFEKLVGETWILYRILIADEKPDDDSPWKVFLV